MTDNEIIKALECCATDKPDDCFQCPYDKMVYNPGYDGCADRCRKDALDLINRQKAENEELRSDKIIAETHERNARNLFTDCVKQLEEARVEIKELKDILEKVPTNAYDLQVEASEKLENQIKSEAIKEFAKKIDKILERYSAIHNSAEIAMQDVIECDNETIEMQSVWDVHTLIANEIGSEPEEMNRLQDNIETIAKERLLKEIEKDFRLLVKEMTESLKWNHRKEYEKNG